MTQLDAMLFTDRFELFALCILFAEQCRNFVDRVRRLITTISLPVLIRSS